MKNGSTRARQVAAGVGDRVEYHAAKVERKSRSVWHWLFGGDDETVHRKPKPAPNPEQPADQLPSYPQQYVGKQN